MGELVRIENAKSKSPVNEHARFHSSMNSMAFAGTITLRFDLLDLGLLKRPR